MFHSQNFEQIKKWYELGLWSEKRVKDAVIKKFITEKEYTEITGKEYK